MQSHGTFDVLQDTISRHTEKLQISSVIYVFSFFFFVIAHQGKICENSNNSFH